MSNDSFNIAGKKSLKSIFWGLIIMLFSALMFWLILKDGIQDYGKFMTTLGLIGQVVIFVIGLIMVIKSIDYFFHPEKNFVYKLYGSKEIVDKLIENLYKNKIYEDKKVIIDNKMIMIKDDINSLCLLDKIKFVYKTSTRNNHNTSYNGVNYCDVFGNTHIVNYNTILDGFCNDDLFRVLLQKCKNARFGYTIKNRINFYKDTQEAFENSKKE